MSNVIEYKCPNCGGSLKFDSSTQKVVCPQCKTEFDAEAIDSFKEDLENAKGDELNWKTVTSEFSSEEASSMNVYHCDSCGAEIVGDENVSATTCPFCESPVILKGRLCGALKPDLIIPFKYDKASTKEIMSRYLKSKFFLPKIFRSENKIENVKGIYEPFWIYNADVVGKVFFNAERSRSYVSGDYQITEVSHYRIMIDGKAGFDNIPVDASQSMPDELMESIEPFDYEGMKEFTPVYLAGYLSDKYDVSKDDCAIRANQRFREGTADKFRETINTYTSVRVDSTSLNLENAEARYALFPVWILNSKWKDKKFTFSMNAQTGKIVGNLPCSAGKYATFFALFYVLTAAVIGLLMYLFAVSDGAVVTNWTLIIFASFFFGWIPGLIFCEYHRRALKPVKLQKGAKTYYRQGSMDVYKRKDAYLYTTRTRVKISNSSDRNGRK